MSNVIEISSARRSPAPATNLRCDCGSEWFTLVRTAADGSERAGAVVVDQVGSIGGYCGAFRCNDCGKDF